MIAIGIMLILLGGIFLIAALAQGLQSRSYVACSETTKATVENKTSRLVKNGRVYELYVKYTVDGTTYEKWVGSKADEFSDIHEGEKIDVRYKPGDPKKCARPFQLAPKNGKVVAILGAASVAVGVALYLLGYYGIL